MHTNGLDQSCFMMDDYDELLPEIKAIDFNNVEITHSKISAYEPILYEYRDTLEEAVTMACAVNNKTFEHLFDTIPSELLVAVEELNENMEERNSYNIEWWTKRRVEREN